MNESIMCYDDHIEILSSIKRTPCPNISSATGALEIITINDIEYLHACDVGNGIITYSDSTKKTINVKKAQLDVFLILGQSNAMYRYSSDPSTASPVPPLGTAYYYGTSDDPVSNIFYNRSVNDYGMHSMTESADVARIGNIEAPFAAAYNKITGTQGPHDQRGHRRSSYKHVSTRRDILRLRTDRVLRCTPKNRYRTLRLHREIVHMDTR